MRKKAWTPSAKPASAHKAGMVSRMRGGAFFGKRSRTASHCSVRRVHTAWFPTGLASRPEMTAKPFWLRTSVMARSNVRRHSSTSGNVDSAPSERISSCGVVAVR